MAIKLTQFTTNSFALYFLVFVHLKKKKESQFSEAEQMMEKKLDIFYVLYSVYGMEKSNMKLKKNIKSP